VDENPVRRVAGSVRTAAGVLDDPQTRTGTRRPAHRPPALATAIDQFYTLTCFNAPWDLSMATGQDDRLTPGMR